MGYCFLILNLKWPWGRFSEIRKRKWGNDHMLFFCFFKMRLFLVYQEMNNIIFLYVGLWGIGKESIKYAINIQKTSSVSDLFCYLKWCHNGNADCQDAKTLRVESTRDYWDTQHWRKSVSISNVETVQFWLTLAYTLYRIAACYLHCKFPIKWFVVCS